MSVSDFAAWLHEAGCPPDRAATIAAVGLGSLPSTRVEMIYNLISPADW